MGGRPRSFDEGVVLDRAMELFWRDGYSRTSLQALLKHMGISRQSLYNAFGDKHRLFLAALDRYIECQGTHRLAALEAPEAGFAAIRNFFEAVGDDPQSSCGQLKGCMVSKACMDLHGTHPDVRQRIQSHFERTVRAFRHALNNAVDAGEIETLDTLAVARHLTATLNGMTVMHKGGMPREDLNDVVRVALSVIWVRVPSPER